MEHSIFTWILFLCTFCGLILFDLGITKYSTFDQKKHLALSLWYIAVGLIFGCFVYLIMGHDLGAQYFTGFLVEKTLSLDNIFVIYLIFQYFKIDKRHQHKVLFIGIISALILRAILIFAGSALVSEFAWIMYVFGMILIFTGMKMLVCSKHEFNIEKNRIFLMLKTKLKIADSATKFFIIENSTLKITTLCVALILIEFADIIFAIDSIPAIFMITNDQYIIYTSNMFAILGLRALYFILSDAVIKFAYLKYSLAILLVFIGSKIFLKHYIAISNGSLLCITILILGIGFLGSMFRFKYSRPLS